MNRATAALVLAAISLIFSLAANAFNYVERERIRDVAEQTNHGLVCILQDLRDRAVASANSATSPDAIARAEEQVEFFNEEIAALGGERDCSRRAWSSTAPRMGK